MTDLRSIKHRLALILGQTSALSIVTIPDPEERNAFDETLAMARGNILDLMRDIHQELNK